MGEIMNNSEELDGSFSDDWYFEDLLVGEEILEVLDEEHFEG